MADRSKLYGLFTARNGYVQGWVEGSYAIYLSDREVRVWTRRELDGLFARRDEFARKDLRGGLIILRLSAERPIVRTREADFVIHCDWDRRERGMAEGSFKKYYTRNVPFEVGLLDTCKMADRVS